MVSAALLAVLLSQPMWTSDTAVLLPKGTSEIGVFEPYRRSFGSMEIYTHPLWDLIYPRIGVKMRQWSSGPMTITTRHAVGYPTLLLKALQIEGAGGIVPYDVDVPQIVEMENALLMSLVLGPLTTTLKLEVDAAWHSDSSGPEPFSTIDYPLVYNRTAHWHEWFYTVAGLDVQLTLPWSFWKVRRLELVADADAYALPGYATSYALEHKGAVALSFGSWMVVAGYKLSHGPLPQGTLTRLYPVLDVVWRF